MKKNEEKILKYLSDIMNDNEKLEFENELKNSAQLREDFDKITKIFNELSELENLRVDERYFNSLLPKIYQKLSVSKKLTLTQKIAYIIPVLVVIILYLIYPTNSVNFDEQVDKITQEMLAYYTSIDSMDYIIDFSSKEYSEIPISENFDVSYLEEVKIPDEYLLKYIPTFYEEPQILDKFSNDELLAIYNNIDKIK